MARLSEQIGQPVLGADGSPLGVLVDLTVLLGAPDDAVHRLVIGHRSTVHRLVPWRAVASFGESEVRLLADATESSVVVDPAIYPLPLAPDELLLVRDVLDSQIVDVVGERLVRVGEVLLEPLDDDRLRIVAVDVGWGAVVRRLGLRRLADHLAEEAVSWHDLHLTSARGHVVQLATTRATVHRLSPDELAMVMSRIPTRSAAEVLAGTTPERAADALVAAHHETGQRVVLAMREPDAARVVGELPEPHAGRFRELLRRPRPRRLTRHRARSRARSHRDGRPADGSDP